MSGQPGYSAEFRARVRELVINYNDQMTKGCGIEGCTNIGFCKNADTLAESEGKASEASTLSLTPKQALTRAVGLAKAHASTDHSCATLHSKLHAEAEAKAAEEKAKALAAEEAHAKLVAAELKAAEQLAEKKRLAEIRREEKAREVKQAFETRLTLSSFKDLLAEAQEQHGGDFKFAVRRIGSCFGNVHSLNLSFLTAGTYVSPDGARMASAPDVSSSEYIREPLTAMEDENDNDGIPELVDYILVDVNALSNVSRNALMEYMRSAPSGSGMFVDDDDVMMDEAKTPEASLTEVPVLPPLKEKQFQFTTPQSYVDLAQLDEFYALLDQPEHSQLKNVLKTSIHMLLSGLKYQMSGLNTTNVTPALRFAGILLLCPFFQDTAWADDLKLLASVIARFDTPSKCVLQGWLMELFTSEQREKLLNTCQQYITVAWYSSDKQIQEVEHVVPILGMLYQINDWLQATDKDIKTLSYDAFYNDAVNDELNIRFDFKNWFTGNGFAFCSYPFLLDPALKALALELDAKLEMRRNMQDGMMQHMLMRIPPYLVLRIHRQNLIYTALTQLQDADHSTLKKPLKVVFSEEEGIDEGGLQKEFYQLIMGQLLDAKYGMFVTPEETHVLWFNQHSLEDLQQFELIGKLIGIAIYNGIILDVAFPPVVYKKLCGIKPTLEDLQHVFPDLYKGFKTLLAFDPAGVEQAYCRTFEVTHDVFGEMVSTPLCPNGDKIPLTGENRERYVSLYVTFLLETSIGDQWNAFRKGFKMLCDGKAFDMFRHEELELLVCGSPELDFDELEENARYEDGFKKDDKTIALFWEVVNEMKLENQRKLLAFVTGSDRAPIGGLGNLKFVISKNGEDSDRLPTSHTCFNHLLLPAYQTKEKMLKCLNMAVENSQGFGMI